MDPGATGIVYSTNPVTRLHLSLDLVPCALYNVESNMFRLFQLHFSVGLICYRHSTSLNPLGIYENRIFANSRTKVKIKVLIPAPYSTFSCKTFWLPSSSFVEYCSKRDYLYQSCVSMVTDQWALWNTTVWVLSIILWFEVYFNAWNSYIFLTLTMLK